LTTASATEATPRPPKDAMGTTRRASQARSSLSCCWTEDHGPTSQEKRRKSEVDYHSYTPQVVVTRKVKIIVFVLPVGHAGKEGVHQRKNAAGLSAISSSSGASDGEQTCNARATFTDNKGSQADHDTSVGNRLAPGAHRSHDIGIKTSVRRVAPSTTSCDLRWTHSGARP
jgi:hypothetical protein